MTITTPPRKENDIFANLLSMIGVGSMSKSNLDTQDDDSTTPIVLIHGFDSSCLEFRKIATLLNKQRDVYAIDILGWGFNDHSNITDFTPESKIQHLKQFIENIVGRPCILVGASLGGAIGIIMTAEYPELVKKLVLIDAQGFIDGKGPSDLPNFLARYIYEYNL
jgi:pimeloyl-ACP methyl ester carboxylesterase